MRIYLIRHGETVDNVASLYAGIRDSELTNHGFQQASRLGEYFRTAEVHFTHIYSSHLKRAVKTAEAITKAQPELQDEDGELILPVVEQVHDLVEQDFGSYEGVSFMARVPGSNLTGKEAHRQLHKDDADFVEVESKGSMVSRVDSFLDSHLMPIIESSPSRSANIAIVSHGILLSNFWRRLLQRLPPKSVTIHPEVLSSHGHLDLEHLGGWSNTGYLELDVQCEIPAQAFTSPMVEEKSKFTAGEKSKTTAEEKSKIKVEELTAEDVTDLEPVPTHSKSSVKAPNPLIFNGCTVTIHTVNSRKHLTGLKRTGGGVGSSRHDEKQKKIETFFKRRKIE